MAIAVSIFSFMSGLSWLKINASNCIQEGIVIAQKKEEHIFRLYALLM